MASSPLAQIDDGLEAYLSERADRRGFAMEQKEKFWGQDEFLWL